METPVRLQTTIFEDEYIVIYGTHEIGAIVKHEQGWQTKLGHYTKLHRDKQHAIDYLKTKYSKTINKDIAQLKLI